MPKSRTPNVDHGRGDASTVAGYVLGAAIWTGLISRLGHEPAWAIIAVALAFGSWAIWFGKDVDPHQSLT